MGRTPRLTPEVYDHIIKALRSGLPRSTAAHLCGLTAEAVYEWIGQGDGRRSRRKANLQLYVRFAADVKRAESAAITDSLKVIRTAAADSWQAAAWFLERKNPENWSRKERHEVSGPGDGPIQVEVIRRIIGGADGEVGTTTETEDD